MLHGMPFDALLGPSEEATKLAGTLVMGNREALRGIVGEAAFARALAELDPALRGRLMEATPLSWLVIADVEHLLMACADASGRDVFELNLEMTRRGTEQSLKTVWRMLLRLATDRLLLSRTRAAYARAYDRGRLALSVDGEARATAEIVGRPKMSRMTREAFAVGVQTMLELGGRKHVRVVGRATEDGAHYTIRR